MRTDDRALAALDAEVGLPYRDFGRDVALLETGRAGREGAIHRNRAHWQRVTAHGEDGGGDVAHERRCEVGHERRTLPAAVGLLRNRDFVHVLQRAIDRGKVLLDDLLALSRVRAFGLALDGLDRRVARHDPGEREKARLQDGVDPRSETKAGGHLRGVNHVDLELAIDAFAAAHPAAARSRLRQRDTGC